MKRGMALLLVLALMLALPVAQAAPARTLGAMDLDAAQLQQLQPTLDEMAQAAWQKSTAGEHQGVPGQEGDAIGAYVYEVRRSLDDSLHLRADVYQLHGIQGSVEEAPEDSLTWLCGMEATLRQQEGQPDRWVADSLQLTPPYAAHHLQPYRGAGFELALPDFFVEDAAAQPNRVRFVAQGVEATLTVERLSPGAEGEQAVMQQLAQQNAAFAFSRQFDDLSGAILARAPGNLAFALMAGEDAWVLRLGFPEEREREYSLYFEFLCNSFLVDEVTVG